MDHAAMGGSVVSLLSTMGAFKWLHTRSVKSGEVQAAHGARLDGHDQKLEDVLRRLDETNENLRLVLDHMMNGKK